MAVFHDFVPPPYGGGNQFLLTLVAEFERRGLRVERNTVSATSRACLFNSYNFDFDRLRHFRRESCRMVHRVDGPIGVYRGLDDGTDERILELNHELADATVFQSRWSLQRHRELGLELVEPHVILNTVDPKVFHARGRTPFAAGGKVRLIATSWSDNPRKGGDVYAWLDSNLDPARFEVTFVGRTTAPLARGRTIPPVSPADVADLLRRHDVYVAASHDDPCSNAVLEALSCGLPVVFRRSGGHPELVGEAGLGFDEPEEIPALLEQLLDEYEARQGAISIPTLDDVSEGYLEILGVSELTRTRAEG